MIAVGGKGENTARARNVFIRVRMYSTQWQFQGRGDRRIGLPSLGMYLCAVKTQRSRSVNMRRVRRKRQSGTRTHSSRNVFGSSAAAPRDTQRTAPDTLYAVYLVRTE